MNATATARLPAGVRVFERGWLSSNNILLTDAACAVLVDSGYVSHAAQTVALVEQALGTRPLDVLVNTHLHSDHCGGNAALRQRYAQVRTCIPPGHSMAVAQWDDAQLSHRPTGQNCPRFSFTHVLAPGSTHMWADCEWQVHPAPGHDPHSVMLFAPAHKLLISADALWENGFGVIFPELDGDNGFDAAAATLDAIERLAPETIIPGHGAVFAGLQAPLERARQRLHAFVQSPLKHARHGSKVLLKFKLLEWGQISRTSFVRWASGVPYLQGLHRTCAPDTSLAAWLDQLLAELAHAGVLHDDGHILRDT